MSTTIHELLTAAVKQLNDPLALSSDTVRLDAELLLSHVLKKPRSYLFTWPDKRVSTADTAAFHHCIGQRATGLPVAYITGKKAFWDLNLQVTPNVLIPRPDTELIVELALTKKLPDNAVVADLGTGTGAIALALARERPNWQIYATDNSMKALAVAATNAKANNIDNVTFLSGSWCYALGGLRPHIIVTNPPYIRQSDYHLQQTEIRFEPLSALASGDDGLHDIRQIISQSVNKLMPSGWLLIEHAFDQGKAVINLLNLHGYSMVSTAKDLAGHDRVTMGRITLCS
ncbi:MAG: peptide chain release factor N(5)-glutamine methyltransferase [Endozoicomonas sp. (ex Botrylloides leachii)]|nr:peptide chain release factor N(5)-glutamine methyltransferase [Endozoicomonas sp. (ex Botrylloides leachii)]